jgi:hypothetical protein
MAKTSKVSKKETRKQVEKTLEITLATLEPVIGNKDFKRRLKKAGKALTRGLKNKKGQMALDRLRKLNGIKGDTTINKKNTVKTSSDTAISSPKKNIE